MYESFFGLACEAFSVAPDPRFLYLSPKHRDALAHLNYGLRRGGGFVLLTGEVGAGKTTVWRRFLEELPDHCDVAYIGNPKLGIDALLARILEELRVQPPEDGRVVDPIDALHGHLLLEHAQGRRALIVVDEAQALASDVLEQLRLLTNLVVSADRKLLQVLLIGQPELRTMLQEPALEPVAQRVVARYHLPALAREETVAYIGHRLAVAGLAGASPFDADALRRIHNLCDGVPRRINVLCDRALLCAQQAGRHTVDGELVLQAAREVFDERVAQRKAAAEAAPAPSPEEPAAAQPVQPARPSPLHAPVTEGWSGGQGSRGTGAFIAGGAVAATALVAGLWLGGRTGSAPVVAAAPSPSATAAGAAPAGPGARGPESPLAAARGGASPQPEPAVPATPGAVEHPGFATRPATLQLPVAGSAAAEGRKPALSPPAGSALDALFTPQARNEAAAWRELAQLWGAPLPAGDPCAVAQQRQLRCYQAIGWLGPARLLQRPGLLTLADAKGRIAHVLLVGLNDQRARLRSGGLEHELPIAELERVWRGDFATLWRMPPGYRSSDQALDGPYAGWLAEHLPEVGASSSSLPAGMQGLSARVFAFQLAHGLPPDGVPGPLTVMQINRASGVDEPRLQALR